MELEVIDDIGFLNDNDDDDDDDYSEHDNEENDILQTKLDESWIQTFENKEKVYKDYYLEDVYFTHIHFIYLDKGNSIEKIKEETYLLTKKNEITRDELITLFKNNYKADGKRYALLTLLRCNVTLCPEDISSVVSSSHFAFEEDELLMPMKTFDNIKFQKTINMFQDLNDLLFILHERPHSIMTRREKGNKRHNKTAKKSTL